MRRFIALDLALALVHALREPLAVLRRKNRHLADQLLRASSSTPLNLSEGSARRGADRMHLYRIAAGSAAETRTCLQVAIASGDVRATDDAVARALDLADQVVRITAALTR